LAKANLHLSCPTQFFFNAKLLVLLGQKIRESPHFHIFIIMNAALLVRNAILLVRNAVLLVRNAALLVRNAALLVRNGAFMVRNGAFMGMKMHFIINMNVL
jgi:hypothetical protein